MARSPNNPTKGPPGSTKGKHHKTATRQTPKGPTSNDLTTRLFGIDFWHAVEFSRIKRTPPQTFRPAVGATVQTYPLGRPTVNFGCQPRGAVSLRPAGRPVDNTTRSLEGSRPRRRPTGTLCATPSRPTCASSAGSGRRAVRRPRRVTGVDGVNPSEHALASPPGFGDLGEPVVLLVGQALAERPHRVRLIRARSAPRRRPLAL